MNSNFRENISLKQNNQSTSQLTQFMKDLQNPKKLENLIKQYIESPNFQDWIKLRQIINAKFTQSMFAFLFIDILRDSLNQIKSFSMFMFLYSLNRKKIFKSFPYIRWERLYNVICLEEKQIVIFNSWVESAEKTDQQTYSHIMETLKMVGENFGYLLQNQRIKMTDIEFESIIEWVIFMKSQSQTDFQITCSLIKIIKEARMIQSAQYVSKGHLVLKKLFQNLGKFENTSGNTFFLLDSQIFKQKDIHYFCNIYYQFLTDLNQQNILKVFKGLTVFGITKQVLILISQIIRLLQNNQQYFKLRIIYQQFILPILCQKFKTHKTLGEDIYQISQFCIVGFLKHCYIGIEGLNCILSNIEKIKNQTIRKKWIKIALIVEEVNNLQSQPESLFKVKKFDFNSDIKKQKFDYEANKIWQITQRTGRKHKKYNKTSSNLRGIQNNSNQCYIISVVQSLYMTKQLPKILDLYKQNIKGNLLIMDQLRILFGELDGRIKSKVIVVNYLKEKGPEEFTKSPHQEDVQQYILRLFEVIQKQIKKYPPILKKFKETFQINCKSITKCLKCGEQFQNIQNQYVHTIPHTRSLQFKIQDDLQDYQCLKCHQRKCKNTRLIEPQSKIFIVHINRFSHKNNVLKKQLSNQTIRRKFKDYELEGMICHIGKNMQNGHYVYFSKIGQKKWVQMNDRLTWEFELQKDEQEFQREMQIELTPYILFYKRQYS